MTIAPPNPAMIQGNACFYRQGSALVITLIMTVLVIGLIGLASEQQAGNQALQQLELHRHRAQFAAESFTALLEGKLRAKAVNNTAGLKTNLDDVLEQANWYNLVGFDAGGVPGGSATSAIYLDGCALRWRLEPVKIMATSNTPITDASAGFFVNSERDTTLQAIRRAIADPPGGRLLSDEAQHFHFRVVVEAYALKEPQDVTSLPWTSTGAGSYTAKAQAMRVVQFEDINAFRYMFNYTANDNGGDLEVIADTEVTIIKGGLHSNQRMFFSGTSATEIGPSAETDGFVAVEAADGIFAMDKRDMYRAGYTNAMSAPVALLPVSNAIRLDGHTLTSDADSRPTGLPITPADTVHVASVKDGINERPMEEDLSTYQTWNGSFLGASARFGIGTRIYQFADGTFTVRAKGNPWHPSATPTPTDPYEIPTLVNLAYATDLPNFWFPFPGSDGQLTRKFSDIWPVQPGGLGAPTTVTFQGMTFHADYLTPAVTPADVELVDQASGLLLPPPRPADTNPPTPRVFPRPYLVTQSYFSNAIGENSTNTTGLVIRERGRGTATPRPGAGGAPAVPGDTEEALSITDLTTYNNWMRANYVVYLGRWLKPMAIPGSPTRDGWTTVDVTNEFFNFSLAPTVALPTPTKLRDLMLHEDVFTNQRDQAWFAARGQPGALANVLTLNLAKTQAFLGQMVDSTTPLNVSKKYAQYFNGYIYLERNARYLLDGATPYADPLVARSSDGTSDPFGLGTRTLNVSGVVPVLALSPVVGTIDGGENPLLVRGQPQSQWTAYPNLRGVRIDNAANTGFANAPSLKFTVVTPNTCYLWGNFNTAGGDNPLACGIYADSLIALSNAWKDDASAGVMPRASDTTYQAAFVTHNVPTDRQNAAHGGSGGVLNALRLLEDWSGVRLKLYGAVVVPGRCDFTRSPIKGEDGVTTFSKFPFFDLKYNPTLLAGGAAQPVGAPKQTFSKRVLSNVIGTAR